MLTGLTLQSLAYIMVAISIALLSTAPFEVCFPTRLLHVL